MKPDSEDIETIISESYHDGYCNCEDCFYARGGYDVCSTCGILCTIAEGCPHSPDYFDVDLDGPPEL